MREIKPEEVVAEEGTTYTQTLKREFPPDKDKEDGSPGDPVIKDFTLFFRTPEEQQALTKALRTGNRAHRRRGWRGAPGEQMPIGGKERNKRNAQRRIAKKQRKANGA